MGSEPADSERLVRNPDLLIGWSGRELLVEDLVSGDRTAVSIDSVRLLDRFGRPSSSATVADAFPDYDRSSVAAGIRKLRRLRFLLPESQARGRLSRIRAWKGNLASAAYHAASRDIRFTTAPGTIDRFLEGRVAAERPPPRFKRYRGAARQRLYGRAGGEGGKAPLDRVLALRRTVRDFRRDPVSREDFSEIVRGTWGSTGRGDAGIAGRLPRKTSPSAGSLHPIECYVLAWNVRGIRPGLYHYDVRADELRRLRSGDLKGDAVEAASGQRWVARAAFLCVMTAVFERTLWKYRFEAAYRVLWLDAGHLAQTFCLLATSRGLGSFTTAAIQDTFIEKLIGLDGIREFPVYLCGAGVPVKRGSTGSLSR
ncbi:MAG TPA: SagB family peptide dehydrogenase [Thermoanaerobaculia bacterium]|nr:SagB family peptide dehydrogenase [Thermoanaerobaculia bacterium]